MTYTHPLTTILLATGLAACLTHGQVHQVASTTDDDEPFGNRNSDAGVSVNNLGVVNTTNMRVSLFSRTGSLLDSRQVGDGLPDPWPFVRTDTTTTLGPSRFFDPQTVYHPQSGRLWIVFSEENATAGSGNNDISPLHIAVSREMVGMNAFDSFNADDWWFYTGTGPTPGNTRPAFNLQLSMQAYPDGGTHGPYPGGPISLLDKPHVAVDEQAAYVSSVGGGNPSNPIAGNIAIIPLEHGAGLSILDGDKPAESELTFIRTTELPTPDPSVRHYTVQEPHDQLDNAQFFISLQTGTGDDKDAIRLGGLWFDSTSSPQRWWYSQHRLSATTLADMDVDVGFEYNTNFDYEAVTPDTTAPDVGMDFQTGGSFFASAVMVKINNTDWRIFAVHHVRPQGPTPSTPVEQWVIQWYVIDPDLANFRTASSTSTAWQPEIEAMGRLDTGTADRIHPVILVTPQAEAYIEYTYTSAQVWPQIRRVKLNNSYTGIVGSEITVEPGPSNEYFTTLPIHRDAWADFADAQADPANPCAFWSTHTLVHGQDLSVNDKRDMWLLETRFNCNNANLNADGQVNLSDMLMFTDLFATGARRVDMDTDGDTDSADAALYQAAYDDQSQ